MRVIEEDIKARLSTTIHDPSPDRLDPNDVPVSNRTIPVIYSCGNCNYQIGISTDSFEKHQHLDFSNLEIEQRELIIAHMDEFGLDGYSFIDFCCPKCERPVTILYSAGPSGYWGMFEFEIKLILALSL